MAKIPHRISYDLLGDDVKSLIAGGTSIFSVSDDYIIENTNPHQYDYVRITNGVNRNKIYMWTDNTFKFIGEYEHTHTKSQIIDFQHNHDERYYTKSQINDEYYTKTEIRDRLDAKADKSLQIGSEKPTDNNMWYKEI